MQGKIKARRRSVMRTSRYSLLNACVATILAIVGLSPAQAATPKSAGTDETPWTHWSVQVYQVDRGNIDLDYSFQMAIYENLVEEVNKTGRFQQVFRDGDHGVSEIPNLLVLKTTVEQYTPGSE